ncbi:hypothetical protein AOQ84DRAFT_66617 [Glonium stellatum]|uniref:Uncharacterized protein n=1 Tax=Glonium stellatum TaxID=574774 RepID=A0A8E2FBS2_9PEZI|nr:hypothetical protein AOQ84DRAFT_66617 [Glonium stellatum]
MFATHLRAHDAPPLIRPTCHTSRSRNRTQPASPCLSKAFQFRAALITLSKRFHHKQIHSRQTSISLSSHLFAYSSIAHQKDILLSMLLLYLSAALLLLLWQFSLRAGEGRVDEHHQKHLVHTLWNGCEMEPL